MDKERYTQQIERLHTRRGFEQDTCELLRRVAAQHESEETFTMNRKLKIIIAVCVCALLLTGTVYAAAALLSPSDVSNHFGDSTLAKAFQSEDAIIVDETIQTGEFTITFMGMVSGKSISEDISNIDTAYTYAVVAIAYTDGREIDILDGCPVSITPLISGYAPWHINLFALSNGANGMVQDNVYYYLFCCSSLEPFADHDVALYVYDGFAPSSEIFSFDPDSGEVGYNDSYSGIRAVFDIPLDPSKADPDAARDIIEAAGFALDENGQLIIEE